MFLDTYLASPLQLTHHPWLEEIQQRFANLFSVVVLIHFRHFSICIVHSKTFEMLTIDNGNNFQLPTSLHQQSNWFLHVHMNL